ncbi:MAG: AI-2E family transporter [Crocinitomicaceae bacterium]|tara:strand:+ start:1055 stop:2077 length:1023 start_codon:yes stop_codon:yes gene_type:complete
MKSTAYFFISMTAIVITLIYGKNLLIPFVFALLLWFIVRKIRQGLDKVKFIAEYFPLWIKSLIPSLLLITILAFISKILMTNINELAKSHLLYEGNIEHMIAQFNERFQINLVDYLKSQTGTFDFGMVLKQIFKSLSDLLSNTFIIIIYALFIFLEEANFQQKLKSVFNNKAQFEKINDVLEKIEKSVTSYIGLKTLVSFITGLGSYIALLFIGIDAPVFWAFLIFLLNYIPTIGSLIGTLFPAFFCLLQFGDLSSFLMVLGVVGTLQVIVGNLLEPKLMGNTLNISSFVAIFALSFWGTLWGITGMLLSVPITVIMVIIFSHFSSTRPVAIMLSEKGNI